MEAAAGSNHQQCEPSMLTQGQCQSQTFASSPTVENENINTTSHELTPSDPNTPFDIINSISNVAVEVASPGSNHKQCEPSEQAQVQCQSQEIVSSPTVENENIEAVSQELTQSVTDPNTTVQIINSISTVPVEVASGGSNFQQCEPFVQAQGECQSQEIVPSPIVKNENIGAASHELTPSVTDLSTPVDVINSTPSVPVEVASGQDQGQCHSQTCVSSPTVENDNFEAASHKLTPSVSDPITPVDVITSISSVHVEAASAGSNHQQCEPSVQAQGQCQSQTFVPSPTVENENIEAASHEVTPSVTDPNKPIDNINSVSGVHVDTASDELQQRKSSDSGLQATPSDHKETIPSIAAQRSLEDGYNWLKYGKKDIKGIECPKSYYKCSFPNCQVKMQVERSHDGHVTEITYKGKHDHARPQLNSQMAIDTSNHTKPNGTPELSPVAASGDDVEGASSQLKRIRDEVQYHDNPDSKRRLLQSNSEIPSNASTKEQVYKVTGSVEVDCDELQQRQDSDSRVKATRYNHKGSLSLVTERFCGDGYNWRKYGQKHIKGSEFLRSYFRCTHLDCPVKKKLEQSHDGQITEIIYKGKHDHPKPQPMAVGRILFQEERSDVLSSLNSTDDKSSNGHDASQSNRIDDEAADDNNPESNRSSLKFNEETTSNADAGLNQQQCKSSLQVEDQSESQIFLSLPSVNENMPISSHEMTLMVPNPPVYMVTTSGIVPIEVDSDELEQGEGSDGVVQPVPLNHKETSPSISLERLLENAYYWRKYGQKNIKGSEFPRSYYRCTHPNCQMKMQFVRSHDGRVIEIICRGRHNHPKPQPCSRLAIGAILSIHEETFNEISSLSNTEDKSANGRGQTSLHEKRNGTPDLSLVTVSDDDGEGAGGELNRIGDEVEDDNGPESKRRRKDTGDVDFAQFGRAIKETRVVVETISESDVVDDGYRWCKYGRKMVKGNPYPRNYFRCSNTGCSVKKHVGRALHNPKALITTYEGNHNHDQPPPRIPNHDTAGPIITASDGTLETRSELDTIILEVGAGLCSSPENILDTEPIQSQSHIADPDRVELIEAAPVSAHNDDLNESADGDRSRDQGESFYFNTPPLDQSSVTQT